jgi:hypothetical protein
MKIIERMQYHAGHYGLLVTQEELLYWADTVSKLIEYSEDTAEKYRRMIGFGHSTQLEILIDQLREEK